MADNAGSDPSDDESDPSDDESGLFSDDDSVTSESDDDFDPSELVVYREQGRIPETHHWRIPRNVRRAEVDHSVEFIPAGLFEDCDQLESVLLHEGLLRIGDGAFVGCTSLRRFRSPSTVTEIGHGAFWGCSNLEEVGLFEGLESIEASAFRECTSLEEVRIPASVARIGACAFSRCTNLAAVQLREGLRMIGNYAFNGCESLGSLCVPSSVDEIGEHAFNSCSSFTSVQLNEDLTKMKQFAFRGCTLLECFEFVQLSGRMKAIRMDNQIKSMLDSRLSEMTLALTREDDDEEEDDSDDEEDTGALWEKCKENLERAHEFLSYLELNGAAPVLELALWKAKVEGQGEERVQVGCSNNEEGGQDLSDAGRDRKRTKVTNNIGQDTRLSREDCRVKCGAGVMIPEVMKFFAYSSSWPRLDDSEEENID